MNTPQIQEHLRDMFNKGILRCYDESLCPKGAVSEKKRYGINGEQIESYYFCAEHDSKEIKPLSFCRSCGHIITP